MILKRFNVRLTDGADRTITVTATNLQDVCKEYGARSRYIQEVDTVNIPDEVLFKVAKQQSISKITVIAFALLGFIVGIMFAAMVGVM